MFSQEELSNVLNNQVNNLQNTLKDFFDCEIEDVLILSSAEIEFYLPGDEKLNINSYLLQQINEDLINEKTKQMPRFMFESIEEEDGFNQFEIQLLPTGNLQYLASSIDAFRQFMIEKYNANFKAKPFKDQPGSSIHIHTSIYVCGVNILSKNYDEDDYYKPFYWSIAGLLKTMMESIYIMAPTEECYERFLYPEQTKSHTFIHYPTNCSWGFNNRTCAIRIPKKPFEDMQNCRIEYRVASSLCSPYLLLSAILYGINYGIVNKLECQEPTFGNAFDHEYSDLIEFPKTLLEAKEIFFNSDIFKEFNR